MLNQTDITSMLKTIPWFLDLSPQSLQLLTEIAEVHSFNTGIVIFSEGEKHPYLYIILEGKVQLESFVPGRGSLPHLTAESLDVIGWSSLTPLVRQKTASAIAVEPTRLLAFNANTLMDLCEKDCDLGFIIMKRLANIIASRLLNYRLHLLELLSCQK
jgi:CRP/FNR family transcriptional regulator, cyclic AMP receptor protein